MGCDIHFLVERKDTYNSRYESFYFSDDRYSDFMPGVPARAIPNRSIPFWDRFANRNYGFFGILAGVRGPTTTKGPMGTKDLPKDAGREAQFQYYSYPDAHSWGHCSLQTFFDAHAYVTEDANKLAARKLRNEPLSPHQEGFDPKIMDEYRVIYWFDN